MSCVGYLIQYLYQKSHKKKRVQTTMEKGNDSTLKSHLQATVSKVGTSRRVTK